MRHCGQEKAGNMNALWDRMAEMMHCRKGVLPKSEVESHIFETFRGKLTYVGRLGHICKQFYINGSSIVL